MKRERHCALCWMQAPDWTVWKLRDGGFITICRACDDTLRGSMHMIHRGKPAW